MEGKITLPEILINRINLTLEPKISAKTGFCFIPDAVILAVCQAQQYEDLRLCGMCKNIRGS